MNQLSFASLDFAAKKKRTSGERIPDRDGGCGAVGRTRSVDRTALSEVGPQGGRRPFPVTIQTTPHIVALQWYNLSDPGAEEALYDIQSMRAFAGLELGCDAIPDEETTILNFRHLLQRHDLTKAIFAAVAEHLAEGRAAARHHCGCDVDRGVTLDEEQKSSGAIPR